MPDASLFHEHRVVVDHDGRAEFFPGFLTHEDAERFFTGLHAGLPWEQAELVVFGRPVTEPRLSVWFASSTSTATRRDTPGSFMVTPSSCEASSIVTLLWVMKMN